MKKFIMVFFSIVLLLIISRTPVFAFDNEVTFSDDDYTDFDEVDKYIPQTIDDILKKEGFEKVEAFDFNSFFDFLSSLVAKFFENFAGYISAIFSIIVISSIVNRIVESKNVQTIVNYITTLCLIKYIYDVFSEVFALVSGSLASISEVLMVITPVFSAILLLGGNSFTSVSTTLSLSSVMIFIETLLNKLLVPCISILLSLFVFEKVSDSFAEINLFKSIKKFFLSFLTFVTTIMVTIITFQNILSSTKDSLSARTAKFAASNFIPVVGGAVAESLKTVNASLSLIKSTVGLTAIFSIVLIVLPVVIPIILLKIFFRFFALSCTLLQNENKQVLFDTAVSFLDIMLGIIICIVVLSILIITLFVKTTFAVAV